MEQAVAAGRESIDVDFLVQALEDRSLGRVEFALEPSSTRILEEFAGVEQALLGIIMAVGRSANSETSIRSLDLGVNLTRTNPEAAHWAKTRSSALVVEISESTRAAIRRIMHLAFLQHIPPRETARLLVDLVGLTEAQAEAVWAFRQELLDSPGRLVRRARTTVRVPARGISAELLAKRVREYSERLLRHRALNIARTETIAASNEGQRQVWLQAVENELVSPEVQREWIAAPGERTCPICKALDGQVVGLEERFVLPDGSKVMGPPAHTACRCGQGLTPASLRAASNPCHDPNTGEFCHTGGAGSKTQIQVKNSSSRPASQESVDRVSVAINSLPEHVKSKIADVDVRVVREFDKADRAGVFHHEGKGTIIVAERAGGKKIKNIEHNALHEAGHAFESKIGTHDFSFGTFSREAENLGDLSRFLMKHYLKNSGEAFAETFASVYSDKGFMGKSFSREFPKSLAQMRKVIG